jgi:Flp pilus assembly protein TadB
MLSDYERRQLALIEKGFADEDHRLVAALDPKPAGTPWTRRRWLARALLAFGIALLVIGMLTAADGLFMQGLLFGATGGVWVHWQRRARRAGEGDGAPRGQAHPA